MGSPLLNVNHKESDNIQKGRLWQHKGDAEKLIFPLYQIGYRLFYSTP